MCNQNEDSTDEQPQSINDEYDSNDEDTAETATKGNQKSSKSYKFKSLSHTEIPSSIQYTPEYDENWIYPTGEKDGGSRDDTPIQGLELGIISKESNIEKTVELVLQGLSKYHEKTGVYPRHRIIANAESFQPINDVGLVAVIQPRPDEYTGLVEHMRNFSNTPEDINPNIYNSKSLVSHIGSVFDQINETLTIKKSTIKKIWPTGEQVGDSPIIERYNSLGAGGIYDPTDEQVDLNSPGLDSVEQVDFTPEYLDIDRIEELEPDSMNEANSSSTSSMAEIDDEGYREDEIESGNQTDQQTSNGPDGRQDDDNSDKNQGRVTDEDE